MLRYEVIDADTHIKEPDPHDQGLQQVLAVLQSRSPMPTPGKVAAGRGVLDGRRRRPPS